LGIFLIIKLPNHDKSHEHTESESYIPLIITLTEGSVWLVPTGVIFHTGSSEVEKVGNTGRDVGVFSLGTPVFLHP
jgi:hypothetical protein